LIASPDADLAAYDRASRALLGLIRGESAESRSPADRQRRAGAKLERTRALLADLGDPHLRYPVVHVTGTSGKGSTCAAVAAILTAAGYRVGLRTSPYLQVETEKLQIGDSLIDAPALDRLAHGVLARGQRLSASGQLDRRLGYAEVWSGIAFSWFAEQQIDLAVVEVGAGGRFDATNVVRPVVSVITSVGLDHILSLGPALADIAWHKAGIIKPGATAVVGAVPPEAWSVIDEACRTTGVEILRPSCDEDTPLPAPGMPGAFQRGNAAIAAAVVTALRRKGFAVPDAAVDAGLCAARMPARLERMPDRQATEVWVDGAHNADKIAAVAAEIPRFSPGAKPVVVLGVLGSKDAAAIAATIAPVAAGIVATEPTVRGKRSLPSAELAAVVKATGFEGEIAIAPDPAEAVMCAEAMVQTCAAPVLVTGSLYLAGQVRRRWYADADIIRQRTPWPEQ
jgi:dihydrofolate synthase/folylpolyglutamate synthase